MAIATAAKLYTGLSVKVHSTILLFFTENINLKCLFMQTFGGFGGILMSKVAQSDLVLGL